MRIKFLAATTDQRRGRM